MHTIYTDELVLPSGIVMEIHCHITGNFEAAVRLRQPSCWFSVICS